jgi:hypothetical protein
MALDRPALLPGLALLLLSGTHGADRLRDERAVAVAHPASAKIVVRPGFNTRPSAESVASPPAMNDVAMSMVTMPAASGCCVRAAWQSATSSRVMITPPCAVPKLLQYSGLS